MTREERLAALTRERFECNSWWSNPGYQEWSNDDQLAQLRRLRDLKEAVEEPDGDTLTSVLPDQDEEVA